MNNKHIIFFVLLVLSASFSTIKAQEVEKDTQAMQKVEVPKKNIETYKNNPDFDYEMHKSSGNFITKALSWLKRKLMYVLVKIFKWIFGAKFSGKYLQIFIKVLPYLAALAFTYIIFRFLLGIDLIRLGKNKKMMVHQVDLSDDAQIIQNEDLDSLIKKALANNDYRLAVRYNYLKVLKSLMDNSLIEWHPEKTNRDYVRELNTSDLGLKFRNLTFVYDYIWYGNFAPNQSEYTDIQSDFNSFG